MRSSFRSHIYRQFFLLSLLITVVLFGMVELIYEDIELNMITLEMKNEQAHHFEMLGDKAEIWRTSTTISAYVPASLETFPQLPEVFQGLEVPFWDDIVLGEKEYMIEITELPQGELYIARDITLFEQREDVFEAGMYVIGGMFVLLNFVLAVFSARRIVRPLSELTQDIHRITPETRSARVTGDYRDQELISIAQSVNGFLEDIERFVKREQMLVSMASHELRTPIAVVSGALDVLEERGSLNDKDRKTLVRIREATNDMNANVEAILMLVRKRESTTAATPGPLSQHIYGVVEELLAKYPGAQSRITVLPADIDHEVVGDVTLIRMLLRNLIHNALEHTRGQVSVQQNAAGLQIRDEGQGLPEHVRERLGELTTLPSSQDNESGLGLFIVTLICERLGWKIKLDAHTETGTRIQLDLGCE